MIQDVRRASSEAGHAFGAIATLVPQVVALQAHLQNTMKVQADQNRQVLAMFQAIQRLSSEIRGGSGEMEQGTRTILEEMNRLVRISQEVQSSMAEIAHGTSEINLAIHQISTLTVGTQDAIGEVTGITKRFQI
jgi:methyl-accepting chemotaxis protein